MPLDPPVREDGICARDGCGKELQDAMPKQRLLGSFLAREPFCSARCCRAYHNIALSQPEQPERATHKPNQGSRDWADRSARASYGHDRAA